MASKLNPPSTIVTRRKKRDLEATMKSLKKLLEPPSRSRKKNIPRTISKKVSVKKTRSINRFESFENSSEDGEYYPNKLKRKYNLKKNWLKPKHELKVVIATNKRKRGIPHKGLKSLEEKLTELKHTSKEHQSNALPKLPNQAQDTELPQCTLKSQASLPFGDRKSPLSIQTSSNITKYELVSPPHWSLTKLTVDDLMRMDEDSLSEDDFMEVLTCPSPVWWEDPPDYFNEGVLHYAKPGDLDVHNEAIGDTADKTSIINPTSNSTELKRTETVRETKKSKKMAKLENILGNIKNRVQNKPENIERVADNDIANDTGKDKSIVNDKCYKISNVTNRTDNHDEMNHNLKETSTGNELKNNESDVTEDRDSPIEKRRKISSSGSDMSVNDEDLLRNLENIDIPMHKADTDCTKDKNYKRNSKDNDGEPKDVTNVHDLENQTTNRNTNKQVARHSIEDINSHKGIDKTEKYKDILKRPKKPTNDILDVRLIKIPTNATNEVRIWSKVENFQRHNLKPEDFGEVIDIEKELVFSMIKCNNQIDTEIICIDDDDEEQIKEAIDLDAIGKANDKIDSNFTDMAEIIPVIADKDIIKEDTITISKDLDVRLIETPVAVDEITKPEQISQAVIKEKIIEPPKPNQKQSKKEIRGIKILPMNMIAKVPNSYTNKKNTRTKKLVQQYAKEKTNGKIKGCKIINTKNDNVIRINDLDISIIKVNDHNVERNKEHEVKNDLCITLVTSDKKSGKEMNKQIEVPSKTPVILPPLTRIVTSGKTSDKGKTANQKSVITPFTLPSLTKNPNNKFESPKSIHSISSETTDAEGTISDTNIQFLDEYDDDKRSVDIVFEGETIDIENTDNEIKSKDSMTYTEMCMQKQVAHNNTEKISASKEKSNKNKPHTNINNKLRNK